MEVAQLVIELDDELVESEREGQPGWPACRAIAHALREGYTSESGAEPKETRKVSQERVTAHVQPRLDRRPGRERSLADVKAALIPDGSVLRQRVF